ncbi:MAG TPA: molybdopterin-dependent oxidoreductase, partial [Nitrospirota bacterium]|nr:molybdopterin-dependent oxidoreductase [Nitrospirota bacterium]
LKRHYTRKWDLQTAPSLCVHCGLGCNTIPGERYGTLRRVLNRYNRQVNGYFLCDRGRFGYEFVNSGRRIRKPLVRETRQSGQQPVEKDQALKHIRHILAKSKRIIGIGSPRASLESNFALRSFVGPESFYSGMSPNEHSLIMLMIDILQKGPARTPSLHEVEMADAVLVLGEDLTNTAPLLDLAVRQSVRNNPKELTVKMRIPVWDDNAVRSALQDETGPLFIASITGTKLDEVAAKTFHAAPDDLARLGFAVARELNSKVPDVPDLPDDHRRLAKEIADALKIAKQPLVISGASLGNASVIQAAANIAWSLCESGKPAELCFTVPECNSIGAGLLSGRDFGELLHSSPAPPEGSIDAVIILENDLYRRLDKKSVDDFLDRAKHIIAIDHLIHPTSARADVVLPAGTFAESSGTLVNNEGRAQRYYQVFVPGLDIRDSWKWTDDIVTAVGKSAAGSRQSLDDLINEITEALPVFSPVRDIAPSADFRISGQKVPRQPHRYSGRTSMLANIDVHEPKPVDDPDSPLSFSMEGYESRPPSPLISRYWSPGWNSVQALNKFQQEVGGPLSGGDPGKRLIEPAPAGSTAYFSDIPQAGAKEYSPADFQRHFIFGSEELSSYAPAIVERQKLRQGAGSNE